MNLLARFFPPDFASRPRLERVRIRAQVGFAAGAALLSLFGCVAVITETDPPLWHFTSVALCGGAYVACLLWLPRAGSTLWTSRVILGVGAISSVAIAAISGGIGATAMAWLVLAPVAGVLLGGRKVAVEAAVFALVAVVLVYGADVAGHTGVEELVNEGAADRSRMITLLMMVAMSMILATFFDLVLKSEHVELERSEAFFRTLSEDVSAGVVVLTPEGSVLFANRVARRLIPGVESDVALHDVLGIPVDLMMARLDEGTLRVPLADGNTRIVDVRMHSTPLDGGEGLLLTLADRTADREEVRRQAVLRQRLNQAEKLEGLGLLAGGVAHDFNNLLTPMKIASAFILADTEASEDVVDCARDIHEAALQAERLVQGMLIYGGRSSAVLEAVPVRETVESIVALVSAGRATRVPVHWETAEVPQVIADSGMLRRIIDNLVQNAIDAAAVTGGTVEVRVQRVVLTDTTEAMSKSCLPDVLQPGSFVAVDVTDTGPGIEPEHRVRIFDPFFTTKVNGHGLGLAAVLGGVRQVGGGLLLQSEVGKGTTFRLLLRTIDGDGDVRASESGEGHSRPGGRVLVIDDEPLVCRQLMRVFKHGGWEVEAFEEGELGLNRFLEDPAVWNAVVVDFLMPGWNGAQLLTRMREVDPEVPVVLCSGYVGNDGPIDLRAHGFSGVMPKPFDPDELLAMVGEVARF